MLVLVEFATVRPTRVPPVLIFNKLNTDFEFLANIFKFRKKNEPPKLTE